MKLKINCIKNSTIFAILSAMLSFSVMAQVQLQKFTDVKSNSDANVALEQIERTEFSTRIQLAMRVKEEGESYCLWDVNDKHAFVLEDADTGELYKLQAQNSQLGSCNQDKWIWMLPDDPVEAQLFFPALPNSVKRVKLYEVNADDNSIPAVFDTIELTARTEDNDKTTEKK